MSAPRVDHQPFLQQTFNAPLEQQPHPTASASPQPHYYHAPDHANGYSNPQSFAEGTHSAPTEPQPGSTHPTMVPAQSVTQETYHSPVVAQRGSDWAKDLVKLARSSELKKHTLTLQLHTSHILSAHASLEQRNKKLENVRTEKNWLESERERLLTCLRQVNEDRQKVDMSESSLLKEINEFKSQINTITEGEYGAAKNQVDTIRSELGMPPIPSLQATLEERSASSPNKRRHAQVSEETANQEETAGPSPSRPSLYSVAQAASTTPAKRGPGRPRKVPVSNNTVQGASAGVAADDPPPAKRPRGRPKGSKNKPKAAPVAET